MTSLSIVYIFQPWYGVKPSYEQKLTYGQLFRYKQISVKFAAKHKVFVEENASESVVGKMSAIRLRPQRVNTALVDGASLGFIDMVISSLHSCARRNCLMISHGYLFVWLFATKTCLQKRAQEKYNHKRYT